MNAYYDKRIKASNVSDLECKYDNFKMHYGDICDLAFIESVFKEEVNILLISCILPWFALYGRNRPKIDQVASDSVCSSCRKLLIFNAPIGHYTCLSSGSSCGRASINSGPFHLRSQQYWGHHSPARPCTGTQHREFRIRIIVIRVRLLHGRGVARRRRSWASCVTVRRH